MSKLSKDEARLLGQLMWATNKVEPFANYRAWLRDNGKSDVDTTIEAWLGRPSKAGIGRRLVDVFRRHTNATNLPHDVAVALGHVIDVAAQSTPLAEHTEDLRNVARPAVHVVSSKPSGPFDVGATKFGGHPDLPDDVEWPACKQGNLCFLGQFNCEDFQRLPAAALLPQTGLMSFFAVVDHQAGVQPGWQCNGVDKQEVAVIYTPPGVALSRREPPPTTTEEVVGVERSLSLSSGWDLPRDDDLLPGAAAEALARLAAVDGDALFEARQRLSPIHDEDVHQLLGYPVCSTGAMSTPSSTSLSLATFGSGGDWSWCGGAHLQVHIDADALGRHDFSDVAFMST